MVTGVTTVISGMSDLTGEDHKDIWDDGNDLLSQSGWYICSFTKFKK